MRAATTVLIVDDEAADRDALERLLAAEGFAVTSAADGPGALALAMRSVPDVVVTDLVMPGMDGIALLAELRARGLECPVIVSTGVDDIARALAAIRAGAADYLTKPTDVGVLVFSIERALRSRDLLRDAAALRARNEKLAAVAEQNLQAREELLAIVAHDLRGPLSTITMAAHALETSVNVEAARKVQMIQRAAKRMARLIEDLLDVARIETGNLVLDLAPHRASALLSEVITLLEPVAAEAGVRVSARLQNDFDIHCAFERVVQVLVNLVSNAIDVTARGLHVRVIAERRGETGWFAVEDDGPGIARENLARVFDRGFRVDGGHRSGAGLGLAIAKGIVEAHGGCLGVESDIGAGSAFYFVMPLRGPEHPSWHVMAPRAEPVDSPVLRVP